jgi:hypothetical protein
VAGFRDNAVLFVGRWLLSLLVAFLLFPIAYVILHGPDADFGWLGGMIMMAFLQFISPYQLWLYPLCGGTIAAGFWHFWAEHSGRSAD